MASASRTPDDNLLRGVEEGNLEMVQDAIANGADVNRDISVREDFQTCLLNISMRQDSLPVVIALLEAGADINALGQFRRTALVDAIDRNKLEFVPSLLKYGADVNIRMPDGRTALYYAAYHNYLDVLKLLLSAGADPNLGINRYTGSNTPSRDITPLIVATNIGAIDIIVALLQAGADTTIRDYQSGQTAEEQARSPNVAAIFAEYNNYVNTKGNVKQRGKALAAFRQTIGARNLQARPQNPDTNLSLINPDGGKERPRSAINIVSGLSNVDETGEFLSGVTGNLRQQGLKLREIASRPFRGNGVGGFRKLRKTKANKKVKRKTKKRRSPP